MEVLRTERLVLRELSTDDASFILELLNDPDWLRYIGDRGVRTAEDARAYLLNGPLAMYAQHGFGLWCVTLRDSGTPIGICGLLKRETLEDVDLGFALLPSFRSRGYTYEAASATLAYGQRTLGLSRIVAIVSPENHASMQLLRKLGLDAECKLQLTPGKPEVWLFTPRPMPFADTFLPEYDREMKVTRSLLERVPMDKSAWKPHPKSRTLGALTSHLVGLAGYGALVATQTEVNAPAPASGSAKPPRQYATREELLETFDQNVKKSRDAILTLSEEDLRTPWTLKLGGATALSMPRAGAFRTFLMSHMIHHRGQLSVYLRENDVPLPSIYGPSADT